METAASPQSGSIYPPSDPTALMPVTLPTTPYEVSFNGYPAPIDGKYLALGLTNSGALYSNLATGASVVLVLRPEVPFSNYMLVYELRAGGMNGELLDQARRSLMPGTSSASASIRWLIPLAGV